MFKDIINCKEKLNKICEILSECNDAQVIEDLANRHIAQCSAENIMLWYVHLDNLRLNDAICPHLALDYHNKRVSGLVLKKSCKIKYEHGFANFKLTIL
jgi:hypothetical protein